MNAVADADDDAGGLLAGSTGITFDVVHASGETKDAPPSVLTPI